MKFLEEAEALSTEYHECVKQVVIFFGKAGMGTRGGRLQLTAPKPVIAEAALAAY